MKGSLQFLTPPKGQRSSKHLWRSHVEIEGYSVAYFDHIAVFEAPYLWTSVKGGARTCFIDAWISNKSTKCIWAPPFSNMALWRQRSNQNTQRNNLRFLHGTATILLSSILKFNSWKHALLKFSLVVLLDKKSSLLTFDIWSYSYSTVPGIDGSKQTESEGVAWRWGLFTTAMNLWPCVL